MTDNEIIKALECCKNSLSEKDACGDCPLYEEEEVTCITILSKNALDLINRQKAEIDILIRKKESLRDEIAEQQAEIERLKEENETIKSNFECQQIVLGDFDEIIKKQAKKLKTAKSEAIKEFAERLKEKLKEVPRYDIEDKAYYAIGTYGELIDNLVKEMTEQQKNDFKE